MSAPSTTPRFLPAVDFKESDAGKFYAMRLEFHREHSVYYLGEAGWGDLTPNQTLDLIETLISEEYTFGPRTSDFVEVLQRLPPRFRAILLDLAIGRAVEGKQSEPTELGHTEYLFTTLSEGHAPNVSPLDLKAGLAPWCKTVEDLIVNKTRIVSNIEQVEREAKVLASDDPNIVALTQEILLLQLELSRISDCLDRLQPRVDRLRDAAGIKMKDMMDYIGYEDW